MSGVTRVASTGTPMIAVKISDTTAARLKITTLRRSLRSAAPPRSSVTARSSIAPASAASRISSRASNVSPWRPSRNTPSGAACRRSSA